MAVETMLVRTEGGDVIRREVVIAGIKLAPGYSELVKRPRLYDGETLERLANDNIPTIIKRK